MTKASRLVTIVLWVLVAISAILVVSLMVNISDNRYDPSMGGWINTNLTWSYILMFGCAGVAIIASIIQMFLDKGTAFKGLISLGFMLVIVLIAYLFASDTMPQFFGVNKFIQDGTLTPKIAKLIDTGLYTTYLLFGVTLLAIIWSGISQIISGSKK
ncbi:MAG: hypothetical protein FWG22_03100 [Prolixibacteraceae bacterium]|nr:hypothetical protein [Prolixibacteraceae bacterium]